MSTAGGSSFAGALRGLTTRGRSFIAAGTACSACALVLSQRDLLRVGVLLLGVPLLCALWLSRRRLRLSLVRTVSPARARVGDGAQVQLELTNLAAERTSLLLAEEEVPWELARSPRFLLEPLAPGESTRAHYPIRTSRRGRWAIGPLRVRMADPFGLCEVTTSFSVTDDVVVAPAVVRLDGALPAGRWAGAGRAPTTAPVAVGTDDVATRAYRRGDDLRKVHWRSTARHGELMVRADEQLHRRAATLLLDDRELAHRGSGDGSTFEQAVSAVASVAVALSAAGYEVRLVAAGRTLTAAEDLGPLMEALAEVGPGPEGSLAVGSTMLDPDDGGVVVAVLGEATTADVEPLLLMPETAVRIALATRTEQVEDVGERRAEAIRQQRAITCRLLRGVGWAVQELPAPAAGPTDGLAPAWSSALAQLGNGLGGPVGVGGVSGRARPVVGVPR